MPGVTTAYQTGVHGSRPAASAGCILYSCTTHGLVYRSDGTSWTTFLTLPSGSVSASPSLTLSTSAAAGAATTFVATDATLPIFDATSPSTQAFSDAAAVGVAAFAARRDHKHGFPASGAGAPTTVPYVTTAADGTLSAEVIIPGLGGSADIPAGGGSDDEFDTTDSSDPMTGWTTLGTVDAHDMNTTAKSHYYVKRTGGATNSWGGIYKAWSPSGGSTVTCKLSGYAAKLIANSEAGLFVAEASPGKLFHISLIDYTTAADYCIFNEIWTNVTTYSSSPGSARGSGGGQLPIYFRMVYNSSTSVDTQYSLDGHLWTTVSAGVNPGFTIGAAGVGVQRGGNTSTVEALFDWIRFA